MTRVVVTGMGVVSSIGNNTQEVLASLHSARSGISRADKYAELGFRSQVQGAPTLDTWFKIKGVSYSISSACATSNHCIGAAYEHILYGKQDMMFAGGCEELD